MKEITRNFLLWGGEGECILREGIWRLGFCVLMCSLRSFFGILFLKVFCRVWILFVSRTFQLDFIFVSLFSLANGLNVLVYIGIAGEHVMVMNHNG